MSTNNLFISGEGVTSEEKRIAKNESLKEAMVEADPLLARFLAYKEWKSRRSLNNRPKRIILVRHGESQANVDPQVYMHTPDNKIPLTSKGEEMAVNEGKILRKIIGDETVRFFVSPFIRSRMTCKGIIEGGNFTKFTIGEDPRLREQEWGNYQSEETYSKHLRERRDVGAFYYRFPNGESGADVYDRISAFLDTLFRKFKYKKCADNFIIVSHGITIRLFLMRYFKWTVETFHDLWNPDNCEHVILEREPDSFNFSLKTPLRSDFMLYTGSLNKSSNSEIMLDFYKKIDFDCNSSDAVTPCDSSDGSIDDDDDGDGDDDDDDENDDSGSESESESDNSESEKVNVVCGGKNGCEPENGFGNEKDDDEIDIIRVT